jgi:hypothetical protein
MGFVSNPRQAQLLSRWSTTTPRTVSQEATNFSSHCSPEHIFFVSIYVKVKAVAVDPLSLF